MTRKLNHWLIFIIVLIALPYWWLMLDNRTGDAAAKPLHIADLRQLAASMSGPTPTSVEAENIDNRSVSKGVFVTGAGLKRYSLAIIAYRLPIANSEPIIIDSGTTAIASQSLGYHRYYEAGLKRIQAALQNARLILLLHTHPEHASGLYAALSQPDSKGLHARVRMGDSKATPASAGPAIALAPGVVAIPAPSHTPDSQIVYARLENGREYLFVGDIAPYAANFQHLRAKARLMSYLYDDENRREVFAWLLTIRQLQKESPQLIVVPGHDYDWLRFAYKHGLIKEFFTAEQPVSEKTD